jgi:hypothetical protein
MTTAGEISTLFDRDDIGSSWFIIRGFTESKRYEHWRCANSDSQGMAWRVWQIGYETRLKRSDLEMEYGFIGYVG